MEIITMTHDTIDQCTPADDPWLTRQEAVHHCPGAPEAAPDPATIWRWARHGVRARNGERVYLRTLRRGGRMYLRSSWLDCFFERLRAADMDHFHQCGPSSSPQSVSVKSSSRAPKPPAATSDEAAEQRLREGGLLED